MRRSKAQTADTRQRIIQETATLIREKGLERASVAHLMDAAGMTHGGFYKHFASKDALVAEAIAAVFQENQSHFGGDCDTQGSHSLRSYTDAYLSIGHIRELRKSCAVAALAADTVKLSGVAQETMAQGTKELIKRIADHVDNPKVSEKEAKAIERLRVSQKCKTEFSKRCAVLT
jgi:TetR/AcrR family transcriptional regulator, transcriptional repressor for nem operon